MCTLTHALVQMGLKWLEGRNLVLAGLPRRPAVVVVRQPRGSCERRRPTAPATRWLEELLRHNTERHPTRATYVVPSVARRDLIASGRGSGRWSMRAARCPQVAPEARQE